MNIKENVIYPVDDEKKYLKDFQSFYYQMNSQADNITRETLIN